VRPAGDPGGGLALLVDPDRAEASLWRRFRTSGQGQLRETLFGRYRRFAASLARRHARRTSAAPDVREDLEQFAYRGLLEAIERYDPTRGAPFLAFATRRIAGSIVDGMASLDECGAQLRFRRRLERERLASLAPSRADAGERPATERLADLVTELALGLMLEAEERAAPAGLVGRPENGFDNLAWRQTQALLRDRVEALPEPERAVIRQHYQSDLLFSEIASMLGLSRSRVSQLHAAALARLRRSMRTTR
jgi:RNA polymerase sigma factor for flagellar operon FliA